MSPPATPATLATPHIPVIDTFCFNGEWIVPMRLAYLDAVVEAFVIVESWTTHSGVRKPALFRDIHADWFAPYATKVHWVIVETFPEMPAEWAAANQCHAWMLQNQEAWFRESYQRDIAADTIRALMTGAAGFLVHVSDADEIPRVSLFHPNYRATLLDCKTPVYLEQAFFYYNFHWKKPYQWYRAYILSGRVLTAPSDIHSFTHWRISHIPAYVAPNAGFHFSYFMTPDELQKKLAAFAHRECDQAHWTTEKHLRHCLASGKDLFERPGEHLVPYDPLNDPDFPALFVPYIEALAEHQGV